MSGRGEQEQEEEEELGLLSQRINTEGGREVSRIMCCREPVFLISRHYQIEEYMKRGPLNLVPPFSFTTVSLETKCKVRGPLAILHVVMCNSWSNE